MPKDNELEQKLNQLDARIEQTNKDYFNELALVAQKYEDIECRKAKKAIDRIVKKYAPIMKNEQDLFNELSANYQKQLKSDEIDKK